MTHGDGYARLTLLDCFMLTVAGDLVEVPRASQRVLAFLGLRGRANRAHMVGVLWPDSCERNAFGSLRTVLWRLHQLGADVVAAHGDSLTLRSWVRVDVDDLTRRARGDRPEEPGATPSGCGGGELLPGWYDDWVLAERERLRQLRLRVLERLAADALAQGRYGEAVEAALTALRADPLRESPHRLLIEVHLAEGNYSEALAAYHACRALLQRELGVSPSPTMLRLLAPILRPGAPGPRRPGSGRSNPGLPDVG
jgi:DNA-binding SARP family transcriptional activator